jgi:hypothetical protein
LSSQWSLLLRQLKSLRRAVLVGVSPAALQGSLGPLLLLIEPLARLSHVALLPQRSLLVSACMYPLTRTLHPASPPLPLRPLLAALERRRTPGIYLLRQADAAAPALSLLCLIP